jgi:hypothetical protein
VTFAAAIGDVRRFDILPQIVRRRTPLAARIGCMLDLGIIEIPGADRPGSALAVPGGW